MPTYEPTDAFWADWRRLRPEQRAAFMRARRLFMAGLETRHPHPSLRVKKYQSRPGWYELSWGPDGRALWSYGPHLANRPGPHIVWQRIGTHKILD